MLSLSIYALVKTLPHAFKLIKASVSKSQIVNLSSDEPHLLSAIFDINGRAYQVMIDTGATISCLPENGEIMQHLQDKIEKANLTVELATGAIEYVKKKTRARIRPTGSAVKAQPVQFYIQSGAKDIFGYHALIGLKHLMLFDLRIDVKEGKIYIYHQDKLIGNESPALSKIKATVRVIDNISKQTVNNNIQRLLNRYKRVFTDLDVNPIAGRPMRIYTVHQRPIFAKQRHYSPDEIMAMKHHVNTLLEKGIIEPSESGYAANSRIIAKKNGTGRLVINYIPLNSVTHRDSYVLPHISDILGVIQGKEYFSTLDCAQGFYQIEVDIRDRHKTGFSTPIGNFQFKRCPFGARNSCAVFQAEMNRIFHDGLYVRCVIYVDDILVFGRTRQEHDENLEWVLQKCQEFNVKIKLEKCCFARREVKYLGFVISGKEIRPVEERIETLRLSNPPKDKTELRSIIGKLNFYSRFIPNYSKLLEPLRSLLMKNKDFQWKKLHQEAFEILVNQLNIVDRQVLVSTNSRKIISLHSLNDSIEVLLLTTENKLIMRASRLLSTAEANYTNVEKQLLALILAINKFKLLLNPDNLLIRVSDKSLQKVLTLVNRPERVENLLLKLPAGFDNFEFEIDLSLETTSAYIKKDHVPEEIFYIDGACRSNGKPNCRASWAICAEYDKELEKSGLVGENPSNQSAEITAAIKACELAKSKGYNTISIVTDSKYLFSAATLWIDKWKANDWKDHKNKPVIHAKLFKELLYAKYELDIEWLHVKGHSTDPGNIRADALARSLLDSKPALLNALSSTEDVQQDDLDIISLKESIRQNDRQDMKIIDDQIYYIDPKLPEGSQQRIYVQKSSRHFLLNLAHDDSMYGGHLGIKKTYRKLISYWWPRMHQDVESYVKSCHTCQQFKNPVGMPPGYLHSIPVSEIFENVHLDIVGPLKPTFRGYTYIITATDAFSKWAFARPAQNIKTKDLIKFVEETILSIHGKPKRIITDQGTQFTSSEWKEFINNLQIDHSLTTSYHPQTNGIDERLNGTLVRILRTYEDEFHENWDEHLKWALYIYNTTVHESTGYSPYQVLHGLDPRSPLKRNTHVTSSPKIQMKIRTDVADRIKASQEVQKKYYDRHRSKPNLKVGQLVYFRVHATPRNLTKKLYVKWDGPAAIIGFKGDYDNPKAIKLLDYDNMIKMTVAISDVKPYIDSYQEPSETSSNTQKGGGHTLTSSSDSQDFNHPSFYINTNHHDEQEQSIPNENTESEQTQENVLTNQDDLDISSRTCSGPMTSSPRRVTISNSVSKHFYPKEQCSPRSILKRRPLQPLEFEESDYQPRNIDESRKDPTYKPPQGATKPTNTHQRSDTRDSSANLSTSSRIPRYNFRSLAKRKKVDDEQLLKQSQTNENESTKIQSVSTNDTVASTSTADQEESIEHMEEKSDNDTNIHASLIELNKDAIEDPYIYYDLIEL